MNYIHQLQLENKQLTDDIKRANDQIESFKRLLMSPKHQGIDCDGSRSDWISSADTLAQVQLIRDAIHNFNQ